MTPIPGDGRSTVTQVHGLSPASHFAPRSQQGWAANRLLLARRQPAVAEAASQEVVARSAFSRRAGAIRRRCLLRASGLLPLARP